MGFRDITIAVCDSCDVSCDASTIEYISIRRLTDELRARGWLVGKTMLCETCKGHMVGGEGAK